MTLQQRLILNDKDQQDLTIVKRLQYLKEKGMMEACATGVAADVNDKGQQDLTIAKTLQYLKEKGMTEACSIGVVADALGGLCGW